jgi:hypothetical protein
MRFVNTVPIVKRGSFRAAGSSVNPGRSNALKGRVETKSTSAQQSTDYF